MINSMNISIRKYTAQATCLFMIFRSDVNTINFYNAISLFEESPLGRGVVVHQTDVLPRSVLDGVKVEAVPLEVGGPDDVTQARGVWGHHFCNNKQLL